MPLWHRVSGHDREGGLHLCYKTAVNTASRSTLPHLTYSKANANSGGVDDDVCKCLHEIM
jgi:hypothetical protein